MYVISLHIIGFFVCVNYYNNLTILFCCFQMDVYHVLIDEIS